jgi:hypothetical protein
MFSRSPCRARHAIKAGDNQHIASIKPANHLGQLRPVGLRARGLLLKDIAAAGSLQLGEGGVGSDGFPPYRSLASTSWGWITGALLELVQICGAAKSGE